ncbi:MAG: V-type ATP synthase subunit A [Candidatus Helarchaeota archaeon]
MNEMQISWVSGSLVRAEGSKIKSSQMHELVMVGKEKLIGEIIKLDGDIAHIQVYEETTGLAPGDPIEPLGIPLSVELGPGLLGQVYDGIQRPLIALEKISDVFLKRGIKIDKLSRESKWNFEPLLKKGDKITGGQFLGKVLERDYFNHYIMVPHDVHGTLIEISGEGEYSLNDPIGVADVNGEKKELFLYQTWPVRKTRFFDNRLKSTELFISGQRVIDTFFPIVLGGSAAIPGGFGAGKTVTLQTLAKWAMVDIIIYVGCGERGNEMAEVLEEFPKIIDPKSGRNLLDKMILIANTSNMPVAARESSIYTGVTLGEYFRDMGYNVALMADSTSRWAEALREISSYLEEIPAERGYPSYLASRLAEFFERSGRVKNVGNGTVGSLTIMGAVSPPSSDFSDPVVQIAKSLVEVFWALDKDLAYARHYPAINWNISYSEFVTQVSEWWTNNISLEWLDYRAKAMDLLRKDDEMKRIVKLIGADALPDSQKLILKVIEILKEGFLIQNAYDKIDSFSVPEKQFKMLKIIIDYYDRCMNLIEKKVPVYRLTSIPIMPEIMKMKNTISNDELSLLDTLENRIDKELFDIEKELLRT